MMYPYAEFLLDFDRKHGNLIHHNSPENRRAAFIVETRPCFFLPKVIRNAMYFLGPTWNLYVICGELSFDYLARTLASWSVRLIKMNGVYRLTTSDYNSLLTSAQFWRLFSEDKLLSFQSDSLLCGTNIDEFIDYDYVGAPCLRFDDQYIANGGLSLRSRPVMLECIARDTREPEVPEDVFFTAAVRDLGARMPDLSTATRFSVESIYSVHPVGVHGTDKAYHSIEIAEQIVRGITY